MPLTRLWKKARWSLAHRGLWGTLRQGLGRLRSLDTGRKPPPKHPFDVAHGVDTSGLIGGGDLAVGHAHDLHITAYAGIPPSRFHETIRRWLCTPGVRAPEEYTFVDLGCGKGRALLLASELHFREVVGIELNPELAQVASANVEVWRLAGRALRPVRVVQGDATEFALPPGPCLVYLANPFGAPVMALLLDRLQARAAAGGGPVDILYQTPRQHAVFGRSPAFVPLWSETIPISKEDLTDPDNVYEATDRCNAYRLQGEAVTSP